MKLNYDFDRYEPPKLTEKALMGKVRQRRLVRQSMLLMAASLLVNFCLALFAFYICPKSLLAAIACIAVLCVSLIGNGVISVLFVSRRRNFIWV